MKHVLFLVLVAACGEPEPELFVMPPEPVKAGRIEFTYSGKWRGTAVAHFDEFGEVVALREDLSIHPEKDKARRLVIWKNGKSIICDLDSPRKQAYASAMRVPATILSEVSPLSSSDFTVRDKILGKPCRVLESGLTKAWLYRGICLKIVDKKAGYTKEATAFEELEAIPAKEFKLPDGFKLR